MVGWPLRLLQVILEPVRCWIPIGFVREPLIWLPIWIHWFQFRFSELVVIAVSCSAAGRSLGTGVTAVGCAIGVGVTAVVVFGVGVTAAVMLARRWCLSGGFLLLLFPWLELLRWWLGGSAFAWA